MEKQINIKKKINLGCGPLPLSSQDLQYMEGDISEWLLADLYPENQEVMKLDMQDLSQFPDNHFSHIFSSHSLEHIIHRRIPQILKHWYEKLAPEGKLTINVPDLMYCFAQIQKYENYQLLVDYYYDYFGPRGLLNIIYGSQEQPGEIHFSGFTPRSIMEVLEEAGFTHIKVEQRVDNHSMGVLIVTCKK